MLALVPPAMVVRRSGSFDGCHNLTLASCIMCLPHAGRISFLTIPPLDSDYGSPADAIVDLLKKCEEESLSNAFGHYLRILGLEESMSGPAAILNRLLKNVHNDMGAWAFKEHGEQLLLTALQEYYKGCTDSAHIDLCRHFQKVSAFFSEDKQPWNMERCNQSRATLLPVLADKLIDTVAWHWWQFVCDKVSQRAKSHLMATERYRAQYEKHMQGVANTNWG